MGPYMTGTAASSKAIMALLFVGVLMGALDLAIIGPALPAIQTEFGLDNRELSWLFNICLLYTSPSPRD